MILIAGCGFVGSAIAQLLVKRQEEVAGITKNEDSAVSLTHTLGIPVESCDISDRSSVLALSLKWNPKVVISCVSSGKGDASVYRKVYREGCQYLMEAFPAAHVLFISSTSVYAQNDGGWVDESSPTQPERETSQILLETEEWVRSRGGMVLRPAGIYGPTRSVLMTRFLEGTAFIEGDGSRWINQIHRDDLASAILFLILQHPWTSGELYNVTDGTPLTQMECYQWLATHFNRSLPPFGAINPNRKRGVTSKRISNQKLRSLGWTPQFPSFREGISYLK